MERRCPSDPEHVNFLIRKERPDLSETRQDVIKWNSLGGTQQIRDNASQRQSWLQRQLWVCPDLSDVLAEVPTNVNHRHIAVVLVGSINSHRYFETFALSASR